MDHSRQVSRLLDEEHRRHLELLGQLEAAFGRGRDGGLPALMGRFAAAIEHDVERHFRFEEESIFPRLVDAGDGGIAELLSEEHAALREVGAALRPQALAAAAGTLPDAAYTQLRRDTLEWVERQVSHIQKETMALLPALEDLLDEETDRELAFGYASM